MKIKDHDKKKICLFFNHERGLRIAQNLKKNSKYKISKIYLSKKNLNVKIKSSLKRLKYSFLIIKNVNSKKIVDYNLKNKIDLNIICGFPYIFKSNLLKSAKYGTINLHGGKLPNYKGGSPLNWQIINGEKRIGFSIIKADHTIDGGDILAQSSFRLRENFDIKKVHELVNKNFPKLLNTVLNQIFKNKLNLIKNKNGKTYKQRKPEDGKISWNKMTNIEVYNFIRALTKPYPGAFCIDRNSGKKIFIYKSKKSKLNPKIKPGTIFFRNKFFHIKCAKGSIKILKSSKKLINDNVMF